MNEPASKLATYDDFLALAEDVRAEVLGGMVEVSPAPLPQAFKSSGRLQDVCWWALRR